MSASRSGKSAEVDYREIDRVKKSLTQNAIRLLFAKDNLSFLSAIRTGRSAEVDYREIDRVKKV
jgi:plasmid stability protein